MSLPSAKRISVERVRKAVAGRIAVLWQYMYKAQIWLNILRARHGGIVLSVVLLFP